MNNRMTCARLRSATFFPDSYRAFTLAGARRPAIWPVFFAILALAISGCSTSPNVAFQSARQLLQRGTIVDHIKLAPKFGYLRVTTENATAILALDRLEPHPDGDIQVWFGVAGEVLKIQNGRLIGFVGLRTEWRGVRLPKLPSWSQVAASREAVRWTRTRDVMPGYRFGIRDELALRSIPPVERSALREVDPKNLLWFEERFDRQSIFLPAFLSGSSSEGPLPPARYAVLMVDGREVVLYGEQCLAPDLCLTWQRWSSELQEANRLSVTGQK